MRKSALLGTAFLALVAAPVAGQTQLTPTDETDASRVGTRGASFLALPVGARAQAVAGAYTALASGISALYWNTAATAFDDGTRIGGTYSALYDDLDITHVFAGFILPLGNSRLGLSINTLGSGDITRTTEEFPDGNDPQFGPVFEWRATSVAGHYSRLITDRMGVGFALKFITEGISGAEANFVAGDISLRFETGLLGTTIAAALNNIGTDSRIEGSLTRQVIDETTANSNTFPVVRLLNTQFDTKEVELPTAFRFGLTTQLFGGPNAVIRPDPDHNLALTMDLADATDAPLTPTVGFEYSFRDIVYLRGGKQWANEEQISMDFSDRLSLGGGVAVPIGGSRRLLLDYAYTNSQFLQNTQSFSVEFGL